MGREPRLRAPNPGGPEIDPEIEAKSLRRKRKRLNVAKELKSFIWPILLRMRRTEKNEQQLAQAFDELADLLEQFSRGRRQAKLTATEIADHKWQGLMFSMWLAEETERLGTQKAALKIIAKRAGFDTPGGLRQFIRKYGPKASHS
jgi:hypothetical protein